MEGVTSMKKKLIGFILAVVCSEAANIAKYYCDVITNDRSFAEIALRIMIYIFCGVILWQSEKTKNRPRR